MPDTDARLTRLEAVIDNISAAISKIEQKLNETGKINWAPIAIGVTIFFTVCGSVATIYNTRISTLNSAVEGLGNRTLDLEKGAVERQIKIQTLSEKVDQLDKTVDDMKQDNRDRERSKE